MATNTRPAVPLASNGVITAPPTVGGNRKKAKRRAKQAAKASAQAPEPEPGAGTPAELYDEDPLGYGDEEDDYEYSDAEPETYVNQHLPPHTGPNGYAPSAPPMGNKKNKKKRGSAASAQHHTYNSMLPPLPNPPPPPSSGALQSLARGGQNVDSIWNTSTAQERQNIKEFWLSLSEEERKSLLKIEKEAVLKKMKQQQKHSCSCTVCGRKRTAIEEELEVLYEGYYEELEQYAHHDNPPLPSSDGLMPDPLQHRARGPHPLAAPPPNPHHRASNMHEHLDEEEDYGSDEEEEEYSDDGEEYSDEDESEPPLRGGVPDFFNFGQNLTVKDNLLTVADDLLKNDGRKFIEMMEQLAERRMQRESDAEFAAANPSHPPGGYPPGDVGSYSHEDPLAAGDEFDDDEASYDSQEEYDDEMEDEDEMGGLTEEQRMQEGRRMFQIFAARMFEQRVLNAYREKVAAERQQRLLDELQNEDQLEAQKRAKKERDAAKKKEKKKQQQQIKAEEKARREAEKAAEEARVKEAQEQQFEEQRRKKEEQRKKKEEDKRKQSEELARKEAERQRRKEDEDRRREEAERKARELRTAEKARKEDQRKREREERDAREREARERKAQEDKEKKEREAAKAKAEKEAKEREKSGQQTAQPPLQQPQAPQITKRPSQIGMVAVPGVHPKQTPSGISSPHPSIATPAIPKAPTPARPRQPSQQGSHASSPKQAQSQVSSVPSKSSSPGSQPGQQQPSVQPKTILQKPSHPHLGLQHPMQTTSPLHQQPIQPPPGMAHPQQHPGGFGPMSPMGFPGFQGPHGPMMHGNMGHRGPMPGMFQQQGPPMGIPNRMSFGGPGGMNGMPPPPPGMMAPQQGRGMGYPFDASGTGQPPPGFGQQPLSNHHSPLGPPLHQHTPGSEQPRPCIPNHSRQQSIDKERFESAANQPIARPAPIQRPSSVKPPNDEQSDIDDLSKHLGSSALLADDDEPLPSDRRHSGMNQRNGHVGGMGGIGGFGPSSAGFGAPGAGGFLPFGQGSGLGQANWSGLPSTGISGGWAQNNAAFAANSGFGNIGAPMHRSSIVMNRPLTIRLAICQACKQLNARGDGEDGFHGVDILLRQIEANRPMLDSPPSLKEIEEICETEGDGQNGGGELHVRKDNLDKMAAVKWEQDAPTPDQGLGRTGLGEIGSPMPSRSSPAGFGPPGMGRAPGGFQSLGGAIGTSPNF